MFSGTQVGSEIVYVVFSYMYRGGNGESPGPGETIR